jgi:hypothetical protein
MRYVTPDSASIAHRRVADLGSRFGEPGCVLADLGRRGDFRMSGQRTDSNNAAETVMPLSSAMRQYRSRPAACPGAA